MRATILSFTLALGIVSSASSQTAAAPRRLRDVLTADSIAYLEAPDLPATLERGKQIPIAKILREEEFTQFLGPLWHELRSRVDAGLQSIGENPDSWRSCPMKSVEIGIGRVVPGQMLGFYARIEAARLGGVLRRLLESPDYKSMAKITESDGITLVSVNEAMAANAMGPRGALAMVGETIVVAVTNPADEMTSSAAAKKAMQLLKGSEAKNTLSSDPLYGALTQRLQTKNPEWVVFLKPAALFQEIEKASGGPGPTPAAGPASKPTRPASLAIARTILENLGFLGLKAVALAETYSPGEVSTELAGVTDGEPRGIVAFLSGRKPFDRALLERAYDGIDSFSVRTIEPRLLYDTLYKTLETVGQAMGPAAQRQFPVLEMIARWEKEHGVKIADDYFGSIGTEYYQYSFPPKAAGGFALPDSFFAFRLKDRAKFEKCLKDLSAALEGNGKVKLEVSEGTASRPAVYSLKLDFDARDPQMAQLGMVMQQLGLAVAVSDDWALASTSPVALKNELRKLGKPRDASTEVKKFSAEAPADATSFSYHDWKPTIRTAWDTLASFAALAAGQMEDDIPINLQEIPTSQSITKHLRPSVGYSSTAKDGFYGRSTGSFGMEVFGTAILGVGAVGMLRAGAASMSEPMVFEADEAGEMTPVDPKKPPVEQARDLLRKVDVAVRLYKAETGKLPESLSVLLAPTDDHPRGYLEGMKELPKDPWGQALLYERSASGDAFQLRSFGPNAKDDGGGGDDIQ